MTEAERIAIVTDFARRLLGNMQDIDPDFARLVEDHFWELVE